MFDFGSNIMLLQCDGSSDEKSFKYIELNFENKEDAKTQALDFLSQNYMEIPHAIIDAPFVVQILNEINTLPIFIIGVAIFIRLFREIYKVRHI